MSPRTVAAAAVVMGMIGTACTALAQTPSHPVPAPPSATSRLSTVSINVGTFRNHKGALGCRLYGSPEGFPLRSTGAVEMRVTITGDVTGCTFENVVERVVVRGRSGP